MKITQLLDEAKKSVKAPKHTVKPRNFVAKNATTSGAGAHKDKKKAAKQGDVKHKAKELTEGVFGLSSEEKGKIQNIASEISDIPGYYDFRKDRFTPYGVLELQKSLDNNEEYLKYALSLTSDDYDLEEGLEDAKDNPCWKGYKPVGTKKKGGKTVPNCVPVNEGFNPEYDDEAGMADNNLETLKRAVEGLDDMISTGDNLPEWCQEKIAVAKSMLISVWDYMQSEENSVSENQRNPDLMSQTDYDRYQQSQMDNDKRAFKRQELEHELGHEERGYYQVMIAKNGKWEYAKVQPRREGMNAAMDIIRRLHAKYPSMHLGMMWPNGQVENYGKGK